MSNKEEKVVAANNDVLEIMPLVDIIDGTEGVDMWFEVPGANSGTVDVEVRNQVMSLEARSSLRRNGRPIVFRRSFQLSDGIDVTGITAKTQDGVLSLCLPKSAAAKVYKIKVG